MAITAAPAPASAQTNKWNVRSSWRKRQKKRLWRGETWMVFTDKSSRSTYKSRARFTKQINNGANTGKLTTTNRSKSTA